MNLINFLAAHFAKRNTKFGGGESEGGAGIHFPLTPFSARPARAFSLARKARHHSGFFSKKVRAKCKISPPIETSSFERVAPRGREAAALRKIPRRFAAKWLGGQKSKTADLFVSYLKTI